MSANTCLTEIVCSSPSALWSSSSERAETLVAWAIVLILPQINLTRRSPVVLFSVNQKIYLFLISPFIEIRDMGVAVTPLVYSWATSPWAVPRRHSSGSQSSFSSRCSEGRCARACSLGRPCYPSDSTLEVALRAPLFSHSKMSLAPLDSSRRHQKAAAPVTHPPGFVPHCLANSSLSHAELLVPGPSVLIFST